ncbi:MAG: hypothetical protein ACC656_11215 [Candidatus Heimdallarchaeota archaeon]
MGNKSGVESNSKKNREKRNYSNSANTQNYEIETNPEQNNIKKEYKLDSIPEISLNTEITNKRSETLKEAIVRDIGEVMSEFEIEFVSKFIAISGINFSYSGTKEEQDATFNILIDSIIHKFPQLAIKLSPVQLNYTLKHLIQSFEE